MTRIPTFIKVGSTDYGTSWINPEHIYGMAVSSHGDEDQGTRTFRVNFQVGLATYHLLEAQRALPATWNSQEEALAAFDAFLHDLSLRHRPVGYREPRLGDTYRIFDHEWEVVERTAEPDGEPAARIRRRLKDGAPLLGEKLDGSRRIATELVKPFGFFADHELVGEAPPARR
ncbi:hypothetical protein [Streptomyces specialis]|uniref:hypothetical protein n=1 Tax=Streptomyces specialis TaxID=498367 RepID=UPI00073F0BA3|nr:hypothetical protein [Streptomyces specialis]